MSFDFFEPMRFIPKKLFKIDLNSKIPMAKDPPEELLCTSCLLPMQYQSKIDDKFLWQCFKCGKKFLIFENNGDYVMEETWSPPK